MQPDPSFLLDTLNVTFPLIGLYDAPDPAAFAPLVEPNPTPSAASVSFRISRDWQAGKTVHLTTDNFGCGGAGGSLCGVERDDRAGFLHFLAIDEGLKESEALMGRWLDAPRELRAGPRPRADRAAQGRPVRAPEDRHVLGQARPARRPDARRRSTATPRTTRRLPSPTFSSGCGQLARFPTSTCPRRRSARPTSPCASGCRPTSWPSPMTRPLFEQFCLFDEDSYLTKPFLKRLKKARGGAL